MTNNSKKRAPMPRSRKASDIGGPTRFNRYGASRAYMHMIIDHRYMALLNWIKNG
jgi:hypothetical protein